MKNKPAQELLERYKQGKCTAEERALVEYWAHNLNDDKGHDLTEREMLDAQKEMWNAINPSQHRLRRMYTWPAIAAAVLIFLSAGLLMYSQLNKKAAEQEHNMQSANVIKPGGNKAVLILADGKRIVLDDAANGQIAEQAGIKITKKANGQLMYTFTGQQPAGDGQPIYNTIQTPRGGQYQINLADGSQVWLNAESSLRFPLVFEKASRMVQLTGEGYFEIKHLSPVNGQTVPFKVNTLSHTGHMGQTVEVLGTHFNINAYDDEASVKTTLLEGSVRVTPAGNSGSPRLLKPGQQSVLNQSTFSVVQADTEAAIAWKNGYFRFNDESLESIMRKVSKWYDVDVVFEQEKLKTEPFAGVITRFSSVAELLKTLELTGEVRFKIDGKKIYVLDHNTNQINNQK